MSKPVGPVRAPQSRIRSTGLAHAAGAGVNGQLWTTARQVRSIGALARRPCDPRAPPFPFMIARRKNRSDGLSRRTQKCCCTAQHDGRGFYPTSFAPLMASNLTDKVISYTV